MEEAGEGKGEGSSPWTLSDLTTRSLDPTLTQSQAQRIQQIIANQVQIPENVTTPHPWPFDSSKTTLRIAAMDISYPVDPAQASTHTAASLVLVQIPWPLPALLGDAVTITHLRTLTIRSPPPSFPYIPGLLAFRELGPLLHLLSLLEDEERPDVLLCDGQGIAHPARCGLASHLGVLTGLPSIGSAKSWFIGQLSEDEDDDRQEGGHQHHRPTFPNLGHHRGSRLPLYYSNSTSTATTVHQKQRREPISHVFRSQPGINPIFVSPGHRITLDQASELVQALCTKYRLPDPIRMADHSSREALREWAAEAQRTETEDQAKDAEGERIALAGAHIAPSGPHSHGA